jgi:hypothetical protein
MSGEASAYSKIKRDFGVLSLDVGEETGLFIGGKFVGQSGGMHA